MKPIDSHDLDHILCKTQGAWREASGARFFITGGSGFFGAWILESFVHVNRRLKLGMEAVVLTRNSSRFYERLPHLASVPEIRLCEGDMKAFTFPEERFDFALHAATETLPGFAAVPAAELIRGNIDGTRRFLELVEQRGVRKFLFTSSGAVYGQQPPSLDRIRENERLAPDPMLPTSAYGESKRLCEALVAAASVAGLREGKVARCFAFIGAHLPLDANYAIGNFLGDALARRPIRISGDGTPRRSYLYAADLTAWLWKLLFMGKCSQAYNVGSETDHSILEIAEYVVSEVTPGLAIEVARPPQPEALPHRYIPDTKKACEDLGLAEWINLREAIRRTAAWHRGTIA